EQTGFPARNYRRRAENPHQGVLWPLVAEDQEEYTFKICYDWSSTCEIAFVAVSYFPGLVRRCFYCCFADHGGGDRFDGFAGISIEQARLVGAVNGVGDEADPGHILGAD